MYFRQNSKLESQRVSGLNAGYSEINYKVMNKDEIL